MDGQFACGAKCNRKWNVNQPCIVGAIRLYILVDQSKLVIYMRQWSFI